MTEQEKKEKLTNSRKRHNDNSRKCDSHNPRKRGNDKIPKMRLPRNVEYYHLNNEFDKLYAAAKGPKIFNDLIQTQTP